MGKEPIVHSSISRNPPEGVLFVLLKRSWLALAEASELCPVSAVSCLSAPRPPLWPHKRSSASSWHELSLEIMMVFRVLTVDKILGSSIMSSSTVDIAGAGYSTRMSLPSGVRPRRIQLSMSRRWSESRGRRQSGRQGQQGSLQSLMALTASNRQSLSERLAGRQQSFLTCSHVFWFPSNEILWFHRASRCFLYGESESVN